jgi:hypothetical protein
MGLEWGPLSLVRINEEILERKTELNGRKGSAAVATRYPSIRKKLALKFADQLRSLIRYSSLAD